MYTSEPNNIDKIKHDRTHSGNDTILRWCTIESHSNDVTLYLAGVDMQLTKLMTEKKTDEN